MPATLNVRIGMLFDHLRLVDVNVKGSNLLSKAVLCRGCLLNLEITSLEVNSASSLCISLKNHS